MPSLVLNPSACQAIFFRVWLRECLENESRMRKGCATAGKVAEITRMHGKRNAAMDELLPALKKGDYTHPGSVSCEPQGSRLPGGHFQRWHDQSVASARQRMLQSQETEHQYVCSIVSRPAAVQCGVLDNVNECISLKLPICCFSTAPTQEVVVRACTSGAVGQRTDLMSQRSWVRAPPSAFLPL